MAKLHVLIGIPGSGKSTYAKGLKEKFQCEIISTDAVRNMHPDWEERLIFPETYRLIYENLKNKDNVIFDATSITPHVRERLIKELIPYNIEYSMVAYYFPIHYNKCLERILKRNNDPHERFFPPEALKSYSERIIAPSLSEGFSEINIIEQTKLQEIPKFLLEDLVIDNQQGYAFYYGEKRGEISIYEGKVKDKNSEDIKSNTNFRLASVSKQFIGYAIYQLIKEGKLQYETRLNDIFFVGEYADNITIKHLLNHTSGLVDYETMEHTDEQISDNDVLEFLKKQDKLKFIPGTEYAYSNTAYVVLGLIIEKITSQNLDEYIEKKVFAKANMKNSKVDNEPVTEISNRAYGHVIENYELLVNDQYWCSATRGDGGLYSSVDDLKNWLDFLYELYQEDKEFFTPNILPNGTNTEYCIGIRHIVRKGLDIIYHCGETIGTNTIIGFIPNEGKKFIFLTNLNGISTDKIIDNLIKIL